MLLVLTVMIIVVVPIMRMSTTKITLILEMRIKTWVANSGSMITPVAHYQIVPGSGGF